MCSILFAGGFLSRRILAQFIDLYVFYSLAKSSEKRVFARLFLILLCYTHPDYVFLSRNSNNKSANCVQTTFGPVSAVSCCANEGRVARGNTVYFHQCIKCGFIFLFIAISVRYFCKNQIIFAEA